METTCSFLSLRSHILQLPALTLQIFFIRAILNFARNHFTLLPDSSICSARFTVSRYTREIDHVETAECVFCLSDIEEGEEIRELKCEHLFHRWCLDKWAKFGWTECPLCRDSWLPSETKTKLLEMDDEDINGLSGLNWVAAFVHNGWWLWWILSWSWAPCFRACSD